MNRNICFFEPNEILAERLIEYWMSHGLKQYNIISYSSEALFLEHFQTLTAKLWVLDVCIKERLPKMPSSRFLWLSENPEEADAVFKYRSAALLLQTILNCLEPGYANTVEGTKLISLYTPVHRSLQTSFGITLSHLLARKGRTLYLNLEGYSGFEKKLSRYYTKDISDFIYHFIHSKEKNPFITTNFIYRFGEVDMIPPVLNAANLQEITGEMWQEVLCALRTEHRYDYIVVDASDFVRGIYEILQISQVVFSMTKADENAMFKWQQYEAMLEALGLEEILRRTQKLVVPQGLHAAFHLEEYVEDAFSQYVQGIVKEVGL